MGLMIARDLAPTRAPVGRCECCGPAAWGEEWQIGTAAFWVQQAAEFPAGMGRHRLGANLREEVAVCMLGGYGIPGEVGNAAFVALREAGLLAGGLAEEQMAQGMSAVLARRLDVGGRKMRYRFHQQRPRRLAAALASLSAWEVEETALDDLELRDRLMLLPGVGPKTASWVVRNHRDSGAVAIVDIHVQRAGIDAGGSVRSGHSPATTTGSSPPSLAGPRQVQCQPQTWMPRSGGSCRPSPDVAATRRPVGPLWRRQPRKRSSRSSVFSAMRLDACRQSTRTCVLGDALGGSARPAGRERTNVPDQAAH